MKYNNLLAATAASLGIWTLFAFTEAPVRREKIPASIWKDFARKKTVAVTELGKPFSTEKIERDTNPPLEPRFGDFMNNAPSGSGIDLHDPKAVEQQVDYDPVTDQYIITEKIGDDYFRAPTYMTFSEYMDWRAAKQQSDYFDRLAGAASGDRSSSGAVDPLAKFEVKRSLVDKLFGGTEVDIKPQGNIDLTFGYNYQRLDNPTLPVRTQRQGNFDFGMNISMNATGKIGEKLNLAFNYNTQATFDFDNVMKLHYDPKAGFGEDDILQNVEAGNVSLPLRSQLIKGSQRLFGVKVETKWGRLRLTTVASQQQTKQQNLTVKGGGQIQQYNIPIDEYDENRHFFLTHYNRETFEKSLKCLPTVQSLFKITKIQVWATNDNNQVTTNRRDVVCLADLAEPNPYLNGDPPAPNQPNLPDFSGGIVKKDLAGMPLPDNAANQLYKAVTPDSTFRFSDKVVQNLNGIGLVQVRDFEKLSARMLDPNRDFTYHEDLGFVSINLNVQTDHIVGAAFEYTYNGLRYQVGEFVDEVANQNSIDSTDLAQGNTQDLHQKVLFVKMLKPRTANVKLPIWDLMMKNIYAIGASQVEPTDFRFDIFYEDGKGEKRFIPKVDNEANPIALRPLIQVFRLDTLNQQRDPGPDGVFDFVPGLTINLRSGRVMIPVLEPFGAYLGKQLEPVFSPDSLLIKKYCFFELYDSTVTMARERLEKNRFTLRGQYKSQNSSEISLGSFNIPPGSVRVSGGGIQMVEGRDYEVDYNIGKVRILNDAVLQSGTPVNISFEDNTLFGFNQRTMLGARADYEFSKNMSLGATWMNLFERPLTQKINIGDDPINNHVYGLDFNITKDAPWLTKAVDKIPGINTKAPSNITFQAEAAVLDPGHSKAINTGIDKGGVVYLDDFEGSSSGFDLRTPYTAWTLASIPQNDWHQPDRWPEAKKVDDLAINSNRAKANWYQADPSARTGLDNTNPYSMIIESQEIFPNRQLTPLDNSFLRPLDFTYYPAERGPYNFELPDGYPGISAGLDPNRTGALADPKSRWGGMMRGVTTNDFEQANIEFIEFWMMDPFMEKPDDPGNVTGDGTLLVQLGTMSEDIIKDGTVFYENGLPTPKDPTVITRQTNMGRVPFYQPVVNFFENDPASRELQDIGLDGLADADEQNQFAQWLLAVKPALLPDVYDNIFKDPSNDNYRYFRSEDWLPTDNLMKKYSLFNNPEGNSPVNSGTNFVEAATTYPDIEDVNRDNTFNETESYFSYEIPIKNDGTGNLQYLGDPVVGPLITQEITRSDTLSGGQAVTRKWYRVKIPLNNTTVRHTVGGINDFRAIQFVRVIAKDFDQRVTFRFATFELGRNQWRRYQQPLVALNAKDPCPPDFDTKLGTLDVNNVNIEENSAKMPFNYVLPPGIRRENSVGAFPDALQNEQAMSVNICNVAPCDSRAVYKLLNLDMRQFGRLKMFAHAETIDPTVSGLPKWDDGDLRLFIRLGSDFTKNYYEYSMPLKASKDLMDPNIDIKTYSENVWLNKLDFPLELLVEHKRARDKATSDFSKLYGGINPLVPEDSVKVIGNPQLSLVKGAMIGIKNDAKSPHCAELWLNELRLTGINEEGGYAGLARADVKLADFASVQLSTLYESVRWGAIDQKAQARSLDEHIQFDMATDVQLDKFLPEKSGVRIPFHTNYSENVRNPLYDPQNGDVKMKDKLRDLPANERREARRAAQDAVTIKGYNFTNVRVENKKKKKLVMPWDISNFSVSYAFNNTEKRTPFVKSDNLKQYKGGLDYNWTLGLKPITPFKKAIKKDKYLKFISDFNFNPLPTSYGFNTTLERNNQATTYRFTDGGDESQSTFYNKRFTWDRNYDLSWDLSKGLKFNYDATARSIIDELNPYTTTQAQQRAAIKENLRDGGRLKNFQQNMSASYNLPFKQIPMMDWIQSKASISAGYTWDAASLKVQSFGNTIQNTQQRQINGDFNFETLYNKSKYLSKINKPSTGSKGGKGKGVPGSNEMDAPGGRDGGAPGGRSGGRGKGGQVGGASIDGGTDDPGSLTGGGKGKGGKNAPADQRSTEPIDPNNPAGRNPGGRPNGLPGNIPGAIGPDGKPVPGADPATAGKDEDDGKKGGKGSKKDPKDPKGKDAKKKDRQPSVAERILIRPLMTVRKARLNYTETRASVVPGFMPIAKFLGQDAGFEAPGWEYIIGNQPSNGWLNRQAYFGRMSQDVMISQQVTRNFSQNFDASATLEPFRDFRVELTANRQFQKNNTELFKIPEPFGDSTFEHRAQRDLGSMTVSFYSMQSLWDNDIDGLFDQYEENRKIISARRAALAGNTTNHEQDPGYQYGYGKIQQEVLIPAFLSAYTKKDPTSQSLDLFNTMPKVNWKLTYNGLSKVGKLKNVFSSFNISHGYKSTLTVNSYQTDLQYNPTDIANARTLELTGDYIARYEIPQLVIAEQFAPLIGIDMRFKNEMNMKVDMKKSRTLGMSFIDYQLAEQRTTDYTITWGYKMKNVFIPFLYGKAGKAKMKKAKAEAKKKKKPSKGDDAKNPGAASGAPSSGPKGNDLKFDFNFSFRDDVTANHRLDSGQKAQRTRGSRTYRISPTVDYSLNKRLTMGLYCDYNKTVPKTSASYPITNIQSGLRVRFTLQ